MKVILFDLKINMAEIDRKIKEALECPGGGIGRHKGLKIPR